MLREIFLGQNIVKTVLNSFLEFYSEEKSLSQSISCIRWKGRRIKIKKTAVDK